VPSHDHVHASAAAAHRGRLAAVLAITLVVLAVEVAGAVWSGSLALLADAGHMATDAAGIGVVLLATQLARREPTSRRTFGWQRGEILAALGNAVLLTLVAVYVLVEGVRRLLDPPPVDAEPMLAVALVGLAANAVALGLLRTGQRESLAVRGAYLEVLGDLLGSLAVVAAAAAIALTGWLRADAAASIVVGLMILPRAWTLLREATDVLLEAAPAHVDLDHVRAHILGLDGVVDVHDLHAWTITSGLPVLSAHVVVDDATMTGGHTGRVLDALAHCLAHHFDVEHSTFQIEPVRHRDHESARHR
jgi:cobalt-zinc-cadmium efflux system protein